MAERDTTQKEEKQSVSEREEAVLSFWQEQDIFQKSLEKKAPKGEFVFYDGPPFATGLPHYGHILAGTIKDAIPRYRTMRGFHVRRNWGWDCHGLPLENEIEKELNLETKRDIEELGIEKFNEAARKAVLRYADEWRRIVPRMGRWVDMERDYRTMDARYTESVWWVFKTLFDKGLVYQGYKSMHLCPRCGTTLSNFEVSQGYADITDIAVYVKLELADEPGTYLIAWTTTPWTLPGNMAAAIHKDAAYIKAKAGGKHYIVAKERADVLGDAYEVVDEFKGEELIGKAYTPPFDYYAGASFKHKDNAWQVYHAPYVETEEGTGIVHLAPAFGEEDLALAKENKIPVVHHVREDGAFTTEVADFAGMQAKPKDDPTKTDVEILKNLAHRNLLFHKEKITHSYPHCWRCDTPLLNYAATSWFVEVTKLRDTLVKENKDIRWVPKEIGTGRFGKWLLGARDWAVSRARYWGAPLPVWENPKTNARHVFGSVSELAQYTKRSGNTYFLMRHGEAESNRDGIIDSNGRNGKNPLTPEGETEVRERVHDLKQKGVTRIITSPLTRTSKTAEIIREALELDASMLSFDERLAEIQLAELDGKPINAYREFADTYEKRYKKAPEGGENLQDVKRRVGEFLYDIDETYKDETILIVTHEYVLWMLSAVSECLDKDAALALNDAGRDFMKTAEVKELSFTRMPHNRDFELDLHRPYIDELVLEEDGTELKRVPEVFDCWFESGSMPYGEHHYPFENRDVFEPKSGLFKKQRGFPADFIAEGLDQTRGWFYSLLVLSVGLFNESAYKNVIVNGTVLAEDGQKMSKRLKNYPDPMDIADRYGTDAMRYYLLSSPVVRGEDLHFSEKEVAEVMRKNISRADNVRAFYALYCPPEQRKASRPKKPDHVLDRWILARLDALVAEVTDGMENYELDRATRPIAGFIDDLSTWYLRRSRDRFKHEGSDKDAALRTTHFVLVELAKVMAPFMPFFAEYLYRELRAGDEPESVHLCSWPSGKKADKALIGDMEAVRRAVTLGLEARAQAGIKVRQPLRSLSVKREVLPVEDSELLELIKDEVNVKEVNVTDGIDDEAALDTNLTPELREEGAVRDIIRYVQDMRKERGLTPHDAIVLSVAAKDSGRRLIEKNEEELKRAVLADEIIFTDVSGEPATFGEHTFTFSLAPRA